MHKCKCKCNSSVLPHYTSPPCWLLYLFRARAEYEQVEGDGRHDIDEEPAFEVVLGDPTWVAHHLVVVVDVGGAEVNEDVHDEHDVHHQVDHIEDRKSVV